MLITESRLRRLVRDELIRSSNLNEGFFDSFLGSEKPAAQIAQSDSWSDIEKQNPEEWQRAEREVDDYVKEKMDLAAGFSEAWQSMPLSAKNIDWVLGRGNAAQLEKMIGFSLSSIEGHPAASMTYQRLRNEMGHRKSTVNLIIPIALKGNPLKRQKNLNYTVIRAQGRNEDVFHDFGPGLEFGIRKTSSKTSSDEWLFRDPRRGVSSNDPNEAYWDLFVSVPDAAGSEGSWIPAPMS